MGVARMGLAWNGAERQAWSGEAKKNKARQGRRGGARSVVERGGKERQARIGEVRRVRTRQGKAG